MMVAIKIQTRARSSLAVKALAAAKAEFEATKSAKAVGSLLLQRVARGMLARKVATTLREAARVKAEEEAAAAAKAAEEAAAAEAARIAAEEEAARIKAEEEAAKAKRAAAQRQRAMSHSAVVCQAHPQDGTACCGGHARGGKRRRPRRRLSRRSFASSVRQRVRQGAECFRYVDPDSGTLLART